MYLTAHLVRAPSGNEGINSFLYLHRERPLPRLGRGVPDLKTVASYDSGYFVAQTLALKPGGNRVIAFLDVAANDDVEEHAIKSALDELRGRVSAGVQPFEVFSAEVVASLGFYSRLDRAAVELLVELAEAVETILPHRNDPPIESTGPLVILARRSADAVSLWLPLGTLHRLPRSPARRAQMSIPNDVFRDAPFDVFRECSMALLGLEEAVIREKGGVEIVDPHSGKVLANCFQEA